MNQIVHSWLLAFSKCMFCYSYSAILAKRKLSKKNSKKESYLKTKREHISEFKFKSVKTLTRDENFQSTFLDSFIPFPFCVF